MPPAIFKQKLLTLLCHDVTIELKEGVFIGGAGWSHDSGRVTVGMDRSQSLQKLLYLSQQLEVFIIITYPSNTTSEDREVSLIKLAHNFFPEIDINHYSRGVSQGGGRGRWVWHLHLVAAARGILEDADVSWNI